MLTSEPVSRRRRRAGSPFSVVVRADLDEAEPPIWRRVELPSTLHLDELHLLLQALFGWEDCHLHRFTQGESPYDQQSELFLCPFDVEEGEDDGVPATDVRLDEVLAEVGDSLLYAYDYGDGWEVRLVVEEVGGRVERVRCVDGQGVAPPEDSGGIHAWNERRGRSEDFAPEKLADALAGWEADRRLPPALRTLRGQVIATPAQQVLDALLRDADLVDGPASVDETEAAEMTRAYSWLLRRVGDGLALTAAGWMPPAVVIAAVEDLGLAQEWMGKNNREDTTRPVRALRASAQSMGLVRANKGRLLRTKVGVAVTDDPVALWSHIAQRLGAPPSDPFRLLAQALLLLAVAAGRPRDVRLHEVLTAAGWRTGDRSGVSDIAAWRAVDGVTAVLDSVRAYGDSDLWRDRFTPATPGAQALARAALLASRG